MEQPIHLIPTRLKGTFELRPVVRSDARGQFVKTMVTSLFKEAGLSLEYRETYYSVSKKGVLRGMHFQEPPADGAKLVYCLEGKVMDVFLDIRGGSPTYGQYDAIELSSDVANGVYLPTGFAHGFYVLSESATLVYQVEKEYSATRDKGILWNSFGYKWPVPPNAEPILSNRDKGFPKLHDYKTLFRVEP